MNIIIQTFLQSHRISVLGVLQDGGKVHSAALHYTHLQDPFKFFFMTEKESQKCRDLINGKENSASLVIGFSEEEFVTFQAEGTVKIVTDEENIAEGTEIYMQKYPSRTERQNNPNIVLLQFTPTLWTYRDYKTKPVTEITSNT